MMELEEKICWELAADPYWRRHTILLAVSGGADSVAMLRVFEKLWREEPGRGMLIVLHANHQLRGAESDADEEFVVSLCKTLRVRCVSQRLDIPKTGDGLEADARQARYTFFEQTAKKFGARYIITAHTRDDQVETILHNFLRGTGLSGLAGMPKTRTVDDDYTLMRPMLEATREEVLTFLAEIGQPFREDSSNVSLQFTRNRIRRTLIPLLRAEFNPRVDDALLRLSVLARETSEYLANEAMALFQIAVHVPAQYSVDIDSQKLAYTAAPIRKELLRIVWLWCGLPMQRMGKKEWDDLDDLMGIKPLPARVFPGNVHVSQGKNRTLQIRWDEKGERENRLEPE